jgi:hypothetical protein
MTDPISGSVRIGTYALEVGTLTESYAAFEPEREDHNVTALHDALAQEAGEVRTPVAVLEKLQANAETVTRKCERAQELSRAAAEGRLLEGDAFIAEVDSLLRLAERLDRDGRFDEELRLLRALHGLLVLVRRWLDLIRVLRRAQSAAEETGDLAAQAWARHELGSLQLCADDPAAAEEQLGQALRLQQHVGQTAGACATRHNLDSAHRDLATRAASKPWSRRRLPRLVVAGSAVALLTIAGTGMAVALDDDSSSLAEPTATTPTTEPSDITTPTTEPSDITTPTTEPSDTTPPTATTSTTTSGTTSTTGTNEPTDTTTTSTTGTIPPVDVTDPVVTLVTPSTGSIVSRTPVFSGTAGVAPGDASEVLVAIVENGDAVSGSPLHARVVDGEWTVTTPFELHDATFAATATQSDAEGNDGSSATITFSVVSLR